MTEFWQFVATLVLDIIKKSITFSNSIFQSRAMYENVPTANFFETDFSLVWSEH